MTIHEQEEKLFIEWEKYLHTNDKIGYDGLLYRGRIYYSVDVYWGREEGDEEVYGNLMDAWQEFLKKGIEY